MRQALGVLLRVGALTRVGKGATAPTRSLAVHASAPKLPRQLHIEQTLLDAFQPTHLEVLNESHGAYENESHFKVVIVSDAFSEMRLLARHRAVNAALLDESGQLPFHSLSVAAAKTPVEWAADADVAPSPKCVGGDGSGMKR